jgi:azurin
MKLLPVACVITALLLATNPLHASQAAKPKAAPAAKAGAKAARTVEITTGDNIKYDVTEIAAKPGETLRIVLKNTGAMPKMAMAHNVVVLKAGTDVVEFNNAAFSAGATEFIPPAMKAAVLANTSLAGPGETVETTFKVPAAPGKYTFLCSFPGHMALGMRGTLTVK